MEPKYCRSCGLELVRRTTTGYDVYTGHPIVTQEFLECPLALPSAWSHAGHSIFQYLNDRWVDITED